MQAALQPVLKQRRELFIACRDLAKKDTHSKSDPFVVVYIKDSKTKHWMELGRTEVIYDNHFPKCMHNDIFNLYLSFVCYRLLFPLSVNSVTKQFRLDYFFEEEQILRFDVFDEDKKGSSKLKDHDILGSCTMVVGEIVHEPGNIHIIH